MSENKKWVFHQKEGEGALPDFFAEEKIPAGIARILARRGILSKEALCHFLYDDMKDLADPFLMKGMEAAVSRLQSAIAAKEKICVYGDYDVDGITSTSILVRYFRMLGADVGFYIPSREKEGYGLNGPAVERLIAEGYRLLVTVDCGISSAALIDAYADRVDFIVTDHHQPPEILPARAVAVVNPHQRDCPYPFEDLAGCGVAFTLCRALSLRLSGEDYAQDTELVALGTVADMVSLSGENRILVRRGISEIVGTRIRGLSALLRASGAVREDAEASDFTTEKISFGLAPRLNAAGRIRHARLGVELMLTESAEEAERLATELCDLNVERQTIEREIFKEATARVEALSGEQDMALVVDGEDWHPGVIGIVGSKILERFCRPTLMVSVRDGVGKGSCRSVPGFNIYEALKAQADLLLQFGGHPMAAGFTIQKENIPLFRKRLNAYARERLTEADCVPQLELEEMIPLPEVTLDFIRGLSLLEPCGSENPRPLFASEGLRVTSATRMGCDGKHFKCVVSAGRTETEAIFWNAGEEDPCRVGDVVAVAYEPEIHNWYGEKVQLVARDIRLSADTAVPLDRPLMILVYRALLGALTKETMPLADVVPVLAGQILCSREQAAAAVRVFTELGIVSEIGTGETVSIRMNHVDRKMDLEMSETYRRHRK